MFKIARSIVVGALAGLLGSAGAENSCPPTSSVTWEVTQTAGGTCPTGFAGLGGEAYDSMIADIVGLHNRRRKLNEIDCSGVVSSASPVGTSCVPRGLIDYGRRSLQEGCQQCTSTDDDDDDVSYSHIDDVDGNRRKLTGYDSGYEGAYLTFTVTSEVPDGEDPIAVMDEVEGLVVNYFADVDTSSSTWMARARALGADLPDDTRVVFSTPEVKEDSVHISRPGDFINHHYNTNSNVRIGTWIGASLAGLAMVLSAKYGVKAYRLQRDATELEQEKASEWANIEETAGDITLNPLAGDSNSGEVA